MEQEPRPKIPVEALIAINALNHVYTYPIVTEVVAQRHRVTRDTFIDDLKGQ